MATLADTFLEDLDELGESSDEEGDNNANGHSGGGMSGDMRDLDELESDDEDGNDSHQQKQAKAEEEDDLDAMLEDIKEEGVEAITALRTGKKFQRFMQKMQNIKESQAKAANPAESTDNIRNALNGGVEQISTTDFTNSEIYQFIDEANAMVQKLNDEMENVYKYVVDLYGKKFPELETLVSNQLDYIRTVARIGNEMDMTKIDLSDLLPSATVMIVSVTGSTTSGQPLSEDSLRKVENACEETLKLEEARKEILEFVESQMTHLAPNLTAIVGSSIASRLVALAGGVSALARMPSCNIQVLGQQRSKSLGGFSKAALLPHTGLIFYSDIVQSAPPFLRTKVARITSGKVTLAARVDSSQEGAEIISDAIGCRFRKEIEDKIEKLQEPPKAKTKKALKAPDDRPRRKRGGKRYRKLKERMASELRNEVNRTSFAKADDEYGDEAMGKTLGMLGKTGSGKLRVMKKEQRQSTKKLRAITAAAASSSGATSGLSSSLAFTPVQGIELINPEAAAEKVRQANKTYFSADRGFTKTKTTENN